MAPFIVSQGKELPSLGVAAALLAGGFTPRGRRPDGEYLRIGDRRVPLVKHRVGNVDQRTMLINYQGAGAGRERRG